MVIREITVLASADTFLEVLNENKDTLYNGKMGDIYETLLFAQVKRIGVSRFYSGSIEVTIFDTSLGNSKVGMVKNALNYDDLPLSLTAKDIKDIFGIGQDQAYQLTHSEGFPSIKIGEQIRIMKPELIKWIEAQSKVQLMYNV